MGGRDHSCEGCGNGGFANDLPCCCGPRRDGTSSYDYGFEDGYRAGLEEFEWIDGHGCVTGDCPHDTEHQCAQALREHVQAVATDIRKALGNNGPAHKGQEETLREPETAQWDAKHKGHRIEKRFDDATRQRSVWKCHDCHHTHIFKTPATGPDGQEETDPDIGRTVCPHGSTEPLMCKQCRSEAEGAEQ